MIVKVFEDLGTVNNVERGSSTGEVVNNNTVDETDNTVENGETVEAEGYAAELLEYFRSFDFFATAPEETIIDYLDMFSDGGYDFHNMTQEELDAFMDMINSELPNTKLEDFWGDTATNGGSTGGSNNNGGAGNGGGGSAPVVSPEVDQGNVPEEDFVTPEVPAGDNGSGNSDPWQGDGTFSGFDDLGDGGELITDIELNP